MKNLLLSAIFVLFAFPAGATHPNLVATGTLTSGHCLQSAGSNAVKDSGSAACGGGTGTVTSVTFTGNGIVDSATPSTAVTTTGTVTATPLTQTRNTVLAGPASGSAATPTFRAIVNADLPINTLVPWINYLSGNWYGATHNGTVAAGVVGTADIMYAHPFMVASPTGSETFKACGIFVGTAGVGSTFKCGIYDSTGTGGRPGALLRAASSAVATTTLSTSVSNTLDSTISLPNGTYWVFAVHDAVTTKPICETVNSVSSINQLAGAASVAGAVGIAANYGGWVTSAAITYANPIPPTFGTATEVQGVTGNPCLVALQAN